MKSQIVIDARCLQHPDFARRGIGLHVATMLATPAARDFGITMLFDPALPAPARSIMALADVVTCSAYDASRRPGLFLQPAPMSLPARPILRLVRSGALYPVAIVLDFIPHDFPDLYLTTPQERRAYSANLAALRHYRHFLPISRATERRLHALVPASRGASRVTGVAIRPKLIRTAPPPDFAARNGVLVVAGGDPRKNPEVVLRAGLGTNIRIVGVHDPARRAALAACHEAAGGTAERLIFEPHLADAALAEAYAQARLVIAPSRAEGFSMPVIEAMAQGTPVLAADEPAQAELVDAPERFSPDDVARLRARARELLADPATWGAVQSRQAARRPDFTEAAVAGRFWSALGEVAVPAPAVLRHARPRIALLSPLPPAQSGCADFSAALLDAIGRLADVTVFSDTAAPAPLPAIAFGGPADPTVMRSPRFDAIVAVLGNSGFHRTEMRMLLDYGAAAILHDARLMGFYRGTMGLSRTLGVAAAELGRDVAPAELDAWEQDQSAMPARFLGEVALAAAPLIVHAAETASFVTGRHGVSARLLPFPPYRLPDPASLTPAGRAAARRRLGIGEGIALVASFGHIHRGKDPFRMVEAFGHLATTRRCRFALLGSGDPELVAELRGRASACGIAPDALMLDAAQVPEPVYRDWLAAADIAVQLRRAPPGSISGALMDAVAAGLPAVADAVLTEALEPPEYVTPVPDTTDPATIARGIADVLDRGRVGIAARRAEFVTARGMDRYASLLVEAVLA